MELRKGVHISTYICWLLISYSLVSSCGAVDQSLLRSGDGGDGGSRQLLQTLFGDGSLLGSRLGSTPAPAPSPAQVTSPRQANATAPAPGQTANAPSPVPSSPVPVPEANSPAPVPNGGRVVPVPEAGSPAPILNDADTPAPVPSARSPAPVPISRVPAPAPDSRVPVANSSAPAPIADGPAPVLLANSPAPVPIARAPAPVPLVDRPAPVPLANSPAPVPLAGSPVPVPAAVSPAPILSAGAPAPIPAAGGPAAVPGYFGPAALDFLATGPAPVPAVVSPAPVPTAVSPTPISFARAPAPGPLVGSPAAGPVSSGPGLGMFAGGPAPNSLARAPAPSSFAGGPAAGPGFNGPAPVPVAGSPAPVPVAGSPVPVPAVVSPAAILSARAPAPMPTAGGPAAVPGYFGPAALDFLVGGPAPGPAVLSPAPISFTPAPAPVPLVGNPAAAPIPSGPTLGFLSGSPASVPGANAPAAVALLGGPAPGPVVGGPVPVPAATFLVGAPAPVPVPTVGGPSASAFAKGPAPGPLRAAPAPLGGSPVPVPAALGVLPFLPVSSPAPAPLENSPIPAASSPDPALGASAPAPELGIAIQAPAPGFPGLILPGPVAPAPSQRRAPGPSPRLQPSPSPRQAPAPSPLEAAVPGPNGLAPAPSPDRAPAPLEAATPAPEAPVLAPNQAPAPSPRRLIAPAPLGGPAPTPLAAAALAPAGSPNSAPLGAPGPSRATTPVQAPVAVPAPAQVATPAPSPLRAATPAPLAGLAPALVAAMAPTSPVMAPFPAPRGAAAPAPAPSLAPDRAPVRAPTQAPGLVPQQAPAPLAALPVLNPSRAPGPGPAVSVPVAAATRPTPAPLQAPSPLSQIYPASNLPPAAPGQTSTLVTLPSAGTEKITVRTRSGVVTQATPQDVLSDATLFAAPGRLSLVVQSSTSLPELPANAVGVQGATVLSTSPVQGSNGRLFNVDFQTNPGARFMTVSTIAGIGLANGLATAQSNTVNIQLSDTAPTPVITSGNGYSSGQTVTPSFTINFGKQVIQTDPRALYTLTGVDRTDVLYDYGTGRVFITAYILPDQANSTIPIEIRVAAGVTTDLFGNANTGTSFTYYYTPPSPSYSTVATVTNAVSGSAMGVAVAVPLVAGLGSAASVGPLASSTAAVGTTSLLHILSGLQIFYLSSQMNVGNLPSNFQQVSGSFSYTVLDIRLPWESSKTNAVSRDRATTGFPSTPVGVTSNSFGPSDGSQFFSLDSQTTGRRRLLQSSAQGPALGPIGASNGTLTVPNVAGGSSQYVVTSTGLNQTGESTTNVASLGDQVTSLALGDEDNPYETLWRSMFWLGLGLVALTLAVWVVVAFIVYMRWEVPVILHEPRPQFMLLLFGVPAIAQACAKLFGGDGKAIAVGVVVVVVFPLLMILFGVWFVWKNILVARGRRAAWVLLEDPETVEKEPPSCWSSILDVLVGPKGAEGKWLALKRRDSKFVNQFGPLFEVNRGPPMVLTDVTYEADPVTGHCNRGRLQRVYEAPLIKLRRFAIYPHHLQGHNSSIELLHLISTAILLQAFTTPDSYAQVILLILINVLMLIWLRIIRPNGERTELIMAMLGILSTTGVYICGLILLANPRAGPGFRNRIGIAMIVLGLWSVISFLFGLIAFLIDSYSLWTKAYHWLRPSRDHGRKFANVVEKAMLTDPHILARKYGDRWMCKALGVGLFGREVFRREIKNPRKKLYDAVLLANLQHRGKALPGSKRPAPRPSGVQMASDKDDATLPVSTSHRWPGLQQLGVKTIPENTGDASPLNGAGSSSSNSPDHNPVYAPTPEEIDADSPRRPVIRPKRHTAAAAPPSSPLASRSNRSPGGDELSAIIANPFARPNRSQVAVDFSANEETRPIRSRTPPTRRPNWARRTARSEKENF